jgi:hypothetical protein
MSESASDTNKDEYTHDTASEERIDRLLDAIELIEADRREDALPILRDLIRMDNDFEDAWLWMSVAVDDVDRSAVCLDNVLRINPKNERAATALYRLRETEIVSESRRARLRSIRDTALVGLWVLFLGIMVAILMTYSGGVVLNG